MPALEDCTPSNGRSMNSKSSSSFSDQGSASDVFHNYSTSHKAGTSCSWGSLFSFTKKTHAGILLAALVATALNAFLKTLLSVLLGRIFDVVSQLGEGSRSGQSALAEVSKWCIVLAGLGVGNWMASTSFLSLWIVFGELQANEARKHVTSNLLSRDVEWLENLKDGIEGLHIRIHTQTRDLQLALSQVLGLVICDTVTSCASLGIAFYYSWKLTLVLMSTLPVSFMVLAIATRNLDSEVLSQRQSLQKASTIAAASFNGIDVVRVFSGSNREQKKYGDALRLAARHFLAQARCNSIQMGYLAFWSISIFVLGFWYGLVLVEQGLLPGHVLTTFYAVITAFNGVESFTGHWLILSKGKSAAHFLVHLARSKKDLDITARAEPSVILRTCAGSIQLNQVDFAYQSNLKDNIIRGVTMHIPAKQFTFLVGESGSGKSTVCSLMANLLTPIAGEVSIDGHPVNHIQPSCLSRHVSLIHQNSSVMHDSFFNNVACGSRYPDTVSETEVRQACAFVQLESTISQLHSGLATIVGADNHSLSGGQKQRLALARARMRNPAILILDEPTSALDPIGQNIVMNAIREWRKDKTTIVVTHDIPSIRDEDFVFVMRSGTIIRQGRMQDLRNAVTAPCIPKSCIRSDQANLMPASSTLKPRGKGSFHNVANVSETEYQQITLRPSSFIQSPGRHVSISRSRTKDTRKSLIEGWRITDDVERKQQQFSTYLDRHFRATETSYVLEKRHACTKACFAPEETIDNNDQISESSDSNLTGDSSMERKPNCKYRYAEIEDRTSQPDPRPYDSIRGILSTFWPSLGFEDRILCVLALFLCLLAAAATPAFSFCLARLLGAMWSKTDKVEQGLRWASFLIGIAITDGICTGGGHYLFEKVSQTWIDHLRRDIFGKVLIQPKLWCQATQHSPGHLSRCLDRNAQEMRSVVGKFLPVLIVVVAIMSISVVWAMTICWKLALVALSPLPLFVLAIKMYIMVSSKWEQKCNEAASDSSATLKEVLLNFSLIQVFGLGQYFDDKQTTTANKAWRVGLERALYTGPWFGLYQSITLPLTALVFYYGTFLTSQNTRDLNVNDVLQVINLLLFSIGTSFELLNGLPQLTAARVAATELLDYTKSTKTMDTSKHFLIQPDSPLPIEMHNVNFTPEQSSAKVLNEFSHVIDPGSCVAVVGSSGSGKTTMLSLILGLTTPDSSIYAHGRKSEFTLCFGGVPYSILDLQHVRSMMAYVPQQPFLFPATIRDNIAYGVSSTCPNLVQEAVVQAAQSSGIHKFIVSLPDGYDTVVGDGGQALSGGQAQLVNIARALAKRPRLLILDEPTSALDSESALDVRIALRSLIRSPCWQEDGMALVIATHSIEMIQMAAEVVVLDKGVKVEQGTYGTLMASRSHLWRLINEGRQCVISPNGTSPFNVSKT